MTVVRYSITVQVLRGAAERVGAIYGASVLRRVLRFFSLLLTRWAQGSTLINLVWYGDDTHIWQHSLFARLAGSAARVLRTQLDQLSGTVGRSRRGSLAMRSWNYVCSGIGQSATDGIPVRLIMDFGLAFLAANVGIRLVLQAYTMRSLLLLSVAFIAVLLLRLSAEGVATALENSRFIRLAAALFTLPDGTKEVK